MLNWDDETQEHEEDFICTSFESMQSHNQEVRLCMLSDPECEACQ